MQEFLSSLELINKDLYKMIFGLFLNLFFVTIIVRFIYYPITRRKDFLFTFFLTSISVYIICFALKKFEIDTGVGLGLFALFGILRYRTDTIPIKEMTYLFSIIALTVMNALISKQMSLFELGLANFLVTGFIFGLEKVWLLKHETQKNITYEKIDLIKADRYEDLKADLEERTGLNINRVEIGKINFLRDTAEVKIYFYEDEQTHSYETKESSNTER